MERTVSAADAKRRFPEILSGVRAGDTVVITVDGNPVARISPLDPREALFARLRSEPVADIGRWERTGLYDE